MSSRTESPSGLAQHAPNDAMQDTGEMTSVAELELFAESLAGDDRVAFEATGPANAIARILEPHVGRVVIANARRVRAIAEAKVKSDKG